MLLIVLLVVLLAELGAEGRGDVVFGRATKRGWVRLLWKWVASRVTEQGWKQSASLTGEAQRRGFQSACARVIRPLVNIRF